MIKSLITCDCLGTQDIDTQGLAKATGLNVPPACTALCTKQIDLAAAALQGGDAIICCTQETRVFEALAEELNAPSPALLDLRDRAGWSADDSSKLPKMSALAAEAMLPAAPAKTKDVVSEGLCLIFGPAETTLPMAEQLKDYLSVTVLLDNPADIPVGVDFGSLRGQFVLHTLCRAASRPVGRRCHRHL